MIPWELVDSAEVPGRGGVLTLHRRGGEFVIRQNGEELMTSRLHGSEDALASLALEKLRGVKNPRVLIGGLGLGYTAAKALQMLGPEARVTVAELVPKVIGWNRTLLAHLAGNPLSDKRLLAVEADVADIIIASVSVFDAILLDVDNGPEALCRDANNRLYSDEGLWAAHRALRSSGVFAVWSAHPDEHFTRRLRKKGFTAEAVSSHPRGAGREGRHTVWIARKAKEKY